MSTLLHRQTIATFIWRNGITDEAMVDVPLKPTWKRIRKPHNFIGPDREPDITRLQPIADLFELRFNQDRGFAYVQPKTKDVVPA